MLLNVIVTMLLRSAVPHVNFLVTCVRSAVIKRIFERIHVLSEILRWCTSIVRVFSLEMKRTVRHTIDWKAVN